METPLDNISLLLLIVLLSLAVAIDFSSHRIPNWLTGLTLSAGLASQINSHGLSALIDCSAGVVIGAVCFIPFYAKKAMGAGDVKLMAAVGSFLGIKYVLFAVAYTLVCGGILALIVLITKGQATPLIRRYYQILKTYSATGQLLLADSDSPNVGKTRFPYALAIAAGTMMALL